MLDGQKKQELLKYIADNNPSLVKKNSIYLGRMDFSDYMFLTNEDVMEFLKIADPENTQEITGGPEEQVTDAEESRKPQDSLQDTEQAEQAPFHTEGILSAEIFLCFRDKRTRGSVIVHDGPDTGVVQIDPVILFFQQLLGFTVGHTDDPQSPGFLIGTERL